MGSMDSKVIKDKERLEEVITLLKKSKLPYQDVKLDNNLFVSYHSPGGELIGTGGLEFYSNYSLLRSVAVDETQRGKALGKHIVGDLISQAKAKSIKEVYLLTETAHDFFIKLGFKDVPRSDVPSEVTASTEFTSVCPVSAACMVYHI